MTTPQRPGTQAMDPSTVPSLGRRFGALMIDWILCLLVSFLFADPTRDGWSTVVVLIAEYTFFLGLFAQTPGMFICRIACVSYRDGGRIGVFRALLRGALLALVVPALLMDSERRGLHDRLSGSVIVPAPRGNRRT